MRFVKVDPSELERGFYKRTKNLELVETFKKSGMEMTRLEDWNYTTAACGANTINQSIKKFGIVGVQAFSRQGKLYLVRVDV